LTTSSGAAPPPVKDNDRPSKSLKGFNAIFKSLGRAAGQWNSKRRGCLFIAPPIKRSGLARSATRALTRPGCHNVAAVGLFINPDCVNRSYPSDATLASMNGMSIMTMHLVSVLIDLRQSLQFHSYYRADILKKSED